MTMVEIQQGVLVCLPREALIVAMRNDHAVGEGYFCRGGIQNTVEKRDIFLFFVIEWHVMRRPIRP